MKLIPMPCQTHKAEDALEAVERVWNMDKQRGWKPSLGCSQGGFVFGPELRDRNCCLD